MQRKKPEFNEEYYGYPTFTALLKDAENHHIVKLRKDERSGTYVVTGFDIGSAAEAAGSEEAPKVASKRRRRRRKPSTTTNGEGEAGEKPVSP
jgi:hypothetical protein